MTLNYLNSGEYFRIVNHNSHGVFYYLGDGRAQRQNGETIQINCHTIVSPVYDAEIIPEGLLEDRK